MQTRLLEMLEGLWKSFWSRRPLVAAKKRFDENRAAPRSRFWTELREGQREAEARTSRPR